MYSPRLNYATFTTLAQRTGPIETSELNWKAQFARVINGGDDDFYWAQVGLLYVFFCVVVMEHDESNSKGERVAVGNSISRPCPNIGLPMPTRLDSRFDKTRCGSYRQARGVQLFSLLLYIPVLYVLLITRKAFYSILDRYNYVGWLAQCLIFTINPVRLAFLGLYIL